MEPKEEAMQLSPELVTVVSVWCHGIVVEEIDPFTQERFPALNVQCGDTVKRANLGDWVTKSKDGIFDVKKSSSFSSN